VQDLASGWTLYQRALESGEGVEVAF
jgi:hypothetical protein